MSVFDNRYQARKEAIPKMIAHLQQQLGWEDSTTRIAIAAKIRPGAASNYMRDSPHFQHVSNGRWRLIEL